MLFCKKGRWEDPDLRFAGFSHYGALTSRNLSSHICKIRLKIPTLKKQQKKKKKKRRRKRKRKKEEKKEKKEEKKRRGKKIPTLWRIHEIMDLKCLAQSRCLTKRRISFLKMDKDFLSDPHLSSLGCMKGQAPLQEALLCIEFYLFSLFYFILSF